MASDGRQPPRRGRRMPVVGEGRQKERGAAGNRPHARGKRQTRGKSTARAPLRVGIECGRGERKKEGGGRTSTSAGRSCPPAGRLCRGAGLHLPPSASARLLTTPPSGPPLHLRLATRVHQGSVRTAPAAPARPHLLAHLRRPSARPPRMLPAYSLVSSAALLPSSSSASLLFLCFPPLPLFLSLFLCFFPCSTSH